MSEHFKSPLPLHTSVDRGQIRFGPGTQNFASGPSLRSITGSKRISVCRFEKLSVKWLIIFVSMILILFKRGLLRLESEKRLSIIDRLSKTEKADPALNCFMGQPIVFKSTYMNGSYQPDFNAGPRAEADKIGLGCHHCPRRENYFLGWKEVHVPSEYRYWAANWTYGQFLGMARIRKSPSLKGTCL